LKISNEFKIIIAFFIFCLLFYFLYSLKDILTPVFVSMFLAYLFDPVVDRLEKYFSRTFAIITLIFFTIMIFSVFIIFVIPAFVGEFNKLYKLITSSIPDIQAFIGKFSFLTDNSLTYLKKILPQSIHIVNKIINNTILIISNFLNILLIPVFTFYFLKEFDNIRLNVLDKIPVKFQNKVIDISKKIDDSVSSFVRGQLLVCVILGALYSIGLIIINVDLALIIGIFSGFASIIPYFGFLIGIILSLIVSFIKYHTIAGLIKVLIVFSIVQAMESFIITPKIVGDKVGLHPVVVILSLLIFGKIFGFIGLIIAIPLASFLKVIYNEFIIYYKNSSYYQ